MSAFAKLLFQSNYTFCKSDHKGIDFVQHQSNFNFYKNDCTPQLMQLFANDLNFQKVLTEF